MFRMDVNKARLTTCVLVTLVAAWVTILGQDEGREPPILKDPLTPDDISEKRTTEIVLTCEAEGIPVPEYEWYVNKGSDDMLIDPFDPDDGMEYTPTDGVLTINSLDFAYEGNYTCRAFNSFVNQAGKRIFAVTVSPKIHVQVAYLEDWPPVEEKEDTVLKEHNYYSLACDEKRPNYSGDTTFVWLGKYQDKLKPVVIDDRVFVDQKGTLHIANVLQRDSDPKSYSCGLSNSKTGKIVSGAENKFVFETSDTLAVVPRLRFSSADAGTGALTFIKGTEGRLECVFSGFPTPTIKWKDNGDKEIQSDGHFVVDNQVLTINNVDENDETRFKCQAGDQSKNLDVDITSPPIWVERLKSTAVPEGRNAVLHCKTKSMQGEAPPNPPRWFRNMIPLPTTDDGGEGPKKYVFSDADRTLTVTDVDRDNDIACFQCFVTNHVGETFGDGCLNVLKPIVITSRPESPVTISKGDTVNLTVLATSDPLYPLSYEWIFKNHTYKHNDAPPYVDYDKLTRLAFINTSGFSNEQMKNVSGVYTIRVFHAYEAVNVTVDVRLQSEVGPAAAGFPFWIIGLILGLLILILLIIICCCVICRRKMQEGDYPVDKKETAAGLDPEKEVEEGGFPHLSRAEDPNQNQKASHLDLDDLSDRDDESFGGTEYGEEPTAFNEDGSFINAYRGKQKNPVDNPAFDTIVHPKVNPAFNPNESAV